MHDLSKHTTAFVTTFDLAQKHMDIVSRVLCLKVPDQASATAVKSSSLSTQSMVHLLLNSVNIFSNTDCHLGTAQYHLSRKCVA